MAWNALSLLAAILTARRLGVEGTAKLLIPETLLIGCPRELLLAVGAGELLGAIVRWSAVGAKRRTAPLHELGPGGNGIGWNLVGALDNAGVETSQILISPNASRKAGPLLPMPGVEALLARGHRVFVVYEACGFGFGLCRRLEALGATCYVIAPRALDEARKGVKTDALDAGALCQRLSRYVAGNRQELAVIRVPTEEEEQLRHVHRQREDLVRARTKLQAQGRSLLVNQGPAAPQRWWRKQGWDLLANLLPAWLRARLAVYRPLLEVLDRQIAALTAELEKAAPEKLPSGMGKLTSGSPIHRPPLSLPPPRSWSPAKSAAGTASGAGT